MATSYRVRQFLRALFGPRTSPDLADLAGLLTAEQKALFAAMAAGDQHHCLSVAQGLAAAGQTDPDLLRAALVHDAGKSVAHVAVWERVAHVLISRWDPALASRLGSPHQGGFAHGLYVLAHHAELGAGLATRAGFPAPTVALLRGAGDPQMQAALDAADDSN